MSFFKNHPSALSSLRQCSSSNMQQSCPLNHEATTGSIIRTQRTSVRSLVHFQPRTWLIGWVSKPTQQKRKSAPGESVVGMPSFNNPALDYYASGPRSPSSTRSLIDPASSPANRARPLSSATFDALIETFHVPVQAHTRGSSRISNLSNRRVTWVRPRPGPRWRPRHSKGRVCFPFMRKRGMRTRVFHCVVSGFILALTLIICTTSSNVYRPI